MSTAIFVASTRISSSDQTYSSRWTEEEEIYQCKTRADSKDGVHRGHRTNISRKLGNEDCPLEQAGV